MSDSTPTRNKQLLDDEHESSSSSSPKPSVVQSSISSIQKGVKGVASGIGNFTHMAISGIAGLMGIPSKAVSIALAVLMGTSSLAIIGTSDTSTDSTAIRSESVTNLDYVDHPNEQEAYFDTLTSLEKVDAAQKIYNYLRSLDYTDESIAGILSNIEAESGLLSDYYTGKEISLYTETNEIVPTGMTSDKKSMYEAFYKRNWRDYTTALYNEYKSDDPYASRGLSNRVRYQIRTEHAELAKSCLAVDKSASNPVGYLPGFGLFQFAGERASNYIYFANCQTVCNDYNHDDINDQWVSTPLQIAYLYFENKECEPGVRVNDWGTTDYYGEYGKQEVVDANDTYATHPNDDKYKDPENWRIAHCVNAMTSTGNIVYEYFTIFIDEEQVESWDSQKDPCDVFNSGSSRYYEWDGVRDHKVQNIKYTMTYKPMLYTFVVDKSKLSGSTNMTNYNNDSYIKGINNYLNNCTSREAVDYMKQIGGTSFTEKDDFLKDNNGNTLDYAGKFETTSYWDWYNGGEVVEKNKAPDSSDIRAKYNEWKKAIEDYNKAVAYAQDAYYGNERLKEAVGRYNYVKNVESAHEDLQRCISDWLDWYNIYIIPFQSQHIHATSGTNFCVLQNVYDKARAIKSAMITTVKGNDYGVAYTYFPAKDNYILFDNSVNTSSDAGDALKDWFNINYGTYVTFSDHGGQWDLAGDKIDTSLDYNINNFYYSYLGQQDVDDPKYKPTDSLGYWFMQSMFALFGNADNLSVPFYNSLVDMYNNGISGHRFNLNVDSNYYLQDINNNAKYTDTYLSNAISGWRQAATNLSNKYKAFDAAYTSYEPNYNAFLHRRSNYFNPKDIDYFGSTINGLNEHLVKNASHAANGSDFYSNALVRKDPKSFNSSMQRGFDTYWYIHEKELGKLSLPGITNDPAAGNGWLALTVTDKDGKPKDLDKKDIGKHIIRASYPYIDDLSRNEDVYSKFKHRYKILWKDKDYSYNSPVGVTKKDEYDVTYRELETVGGKTNGYGGYLLTAAFEFEHIMGMAAQPSNKYQDGEDIAFQNAIYFYTNYLGYDMTGVDPYTAVNSTSSDEKIKSFRAHCKRARYWYRILVNEKWSEKLGIKSPDDTSGKAYEDRRMDYKNEIYSHLPKVNGSRLWCKGTDTVDNVLYADKTKEVFNTQDMVQWATGKADELYNYNGNIFDNHTLASTAVSMSYPYGEECYAVDDTVNKLKFAAGLSYDSEMGTLVDGFTEGYVGRRMTAMNAAVSFVTEAFAYIIDDNDPLAIGYFAEDIDARMGEIAPGAGSGTKESDDARRQAISELGKIIIKGDNPVASIATVIRASGRDDTFPATFDDLYPYLGIAEKPDEYVKPMYDADCSNYTTDISVIKDRLTARNEEDFDESKWSLVDFIHKKKNKQQDNTKKISDGAGKWEVQGILTDGNTNGNKDLISYKSLKPGDICVSYNGIFMFVGSDANTKFFDYPDLKNSKYAVCYATTDTYSLSEKARNTDNEYVPPYGTTSYTEWLSQISNDDKRRACLVNMDGINATGLTCRELDDTGEDLYIKQLIQEARDGMNKGYKNSSPYIVFRSINDDYEMSGYYKLLNACDFRAYQDGRLKSSVLYRSAVSMFYDVTGEQGVAVNSSTDSTTMKAILRKLSACYGFDMDNISSSGGDGPRRNSIADLIKKAKENMANKS